MRLVMLLARTGRRIRELRMLEFDCLLPIHGLAATPGDGDAMVAKLRYQTKIHAEGAICGRRIFDAPTGP